MDKIYSSKSPFVLRFKGLSHYGSGNTAELFISTILSYVSNTAGEISEAYTGEFRDILLGKFDVLVAREDGTWGLLLSLMQ